jgi:hypothetical protein
VRLAFVQAHDSRPADAKSPQRLRKGRARPFGGNSLGRRNFGCRDDDRAAEAAISRDGRNFGGRGAVSAPRDADRRWETAIATCHLPPAGGRERRHGVRCRFDDRRIAGANMPTL